MIFKTYSLERRCRLIKELYGHSCTVGRLTRLYHKKNITYRATCLSWRTTEEKERERKEERRAYAQRLHGLKTRNEPIVYLDETSFHSWMVIPRTWAHKGD